MTVTDTGAQLYVRHDRRPLPRQPGQGPDPTAHFSDLDPNTTPRTQAGQGVLPAAQQIGAERGYEEADVRAPQLQEPLAGRGTADAADRACVASAKPALRQRFEDLCVGSWIDTQSRRWRQELNRRSM